MSRRTSVLIENIPAPIKITDDMLPTEKVDAEAHNKRIKDILALRELPVKEQIRLSFISES